MSERASSADKNDRCAEFCENDICGSPHCGDCPTRLVTIWTGGSTHTRTAAEWVALARADLSSGVRTAAASIMDEVRAEAEAYRIGYVDGALGREPQKPLTEPEQQMVRSARSAELRRSAESAAPQFSREEAALILRRWRQDVGETPDDTYVLGKLVSIAGRK